MEQDSSSNESLMAGDDADFVGEVVKIMLIWMVVVVIAGIALIILREPFTGLFSLAGLF
ncbi:hypothetical protein [Natronobiforma cellulositropha]|uniref:hypothetical protein n=1 Tax=Natronobiforma cellulositropha TaxID=1679076 RepID=UPI0021D5FEED|nr:hypothetical protein [Natronobiforma cellulositropha]